MAAKNGTLTLRYPGKQHEILSFYLDDTAGNLVRFSKDGKAGAASPDNYYNGKGNCFITDICIEAATGQTTTVVKVNDSPISVLLNANYLAAVLGRIPLNQPLPRGSKLTMVQIA